MPSTQPARGMRDFLPADKARRERVLAVIRDRFQKALQAVVDAGACPMQPTTVIDLSGETPVLVRRGRGDPARLGL